MTLGHADLDDLRVWLTENDPSRFKSAGQVPFPPSFFDLVELAIECDYLDESTVKSNLTEAMAQVQQSIDLESEYQAHPLLRFLMMRFGDKSSVSCIPNFPKSALAFSSFTSVFNTFLSELTDPESVSLHLLIESETWWHYLQTSEMPQHDDLMLIERGLRKLAWLSWFIEEAFADYEPSLCGRFALCMLQQLRDFALFAEAAESRLGAEWQSINALAACGAESDSRTLDTSFGERIKSSLIKMHGIVSVVKDSLSSLSKVPEDILKMPVIIRGPSDSEIAPRRDVEVKVTAMDVKSNSRESDEADSTETSDRTGVWRRGRSILVAVGGDFGAGKSTVCKGIINVFGEDRCAEVCLDDYIGLSRTQRYAVGISALDPRAHNFAQMEEDLWNLAQGRSIEKPVYDHNLGIIGGREIVEPRELILVSGVFPLYTWALRSLFDVALWLDPDAELKEQWRMLRDVSADSQSDEADRDEMTRRWPDYERYVASQAHFADIRAVVSKAGLSIFKSARLAPLSPREVETSYTRVRFLEPDYGPFPRTLIEVDSNIDQQSFGFIERSLLQGFSVGRYSNRDALGSYVDNAGRHWSRSLAVMQLVICRHVLETASETQYVF